MSLSTPGKVSSTGSVTPAPDDAPRAAIELKGFHHPTLRAIVRDCAPQAVAASFAALRPADPAGFEWQPVVIDLSSLDPAENPDLDALCAGLRALKLHPVALAGAGNHLRGAAETLKLGLVSAVSASDRAETSTVAQASPAQTMTLDRPVRSGQQVYARDCDLIVIGAVSPGAEVMADGNIHVYGSIQGRALAGARGRRDVSIFALDLQAELVAVAGVYRTFDDSLPATQKGRAVRVTLDPSADRITVRML